jgi:hypothetical protein
MAGLLPFGSPDHGRTVVFAPILLRRRFFADTRCEHAESWGMTMVASTRLKTAFITAAVVALGLVLPGVASAAPPSNDDFGASTVVPALPFTTQTDTSEATKADDDSAWCQYNAIGGTVWFSYTPTADVMLRATTNGSDHETILSAYTGARGEWDTVGDACDISSGAGATVTFRARAGTTYHFMVAGYYVPGGALSFGLSEIAPAANDNFADAEAITGLPGTRDVDLSIASTEYDEPAGRSPTCVNEVSHSVWYAFTPTETTSLTATVTADTYEASVSVYTGSALVDLHEVGCAQSSFSDKVLFRATAGTTYYLRVGGTHYVTSVSVDLAEAPPLQPYFATSSDPTIYELTYFNGYTGEFGTPIASGEWDFGDGTVAPATESGVPHHYTADGTYQVRLSVVSPDGRTGTSTSAVTVTTHDVSIDRFVTPKTAITGDTKEIAVRVANTRYRESVTTELYKSDGSSWELVGTLTLDVRATADRTVKFPFAYTFTAEDAVVGRVAFRAVVTVPYPLRDARPFDNERISAATTVQPGPVTREHA